MLSVAPHASLAGVARTVMNQIERCRLEPAAAAVARRGEVGVTLPLRHGGAPRLSLRFEIVGRDGAPLLIVAGGISAGRHVVASPEFSEPGWWQVQAESFDLDRFRLLAIDWVGADGSLDLAIDPADQADAIAHLLDYLGIERAAAFVGASYGGMVGMHFAARHPGRCGALLAISAPAAPHPFASACRSLQRRALAFGEAIGDGASGVALARAMAMLTYRTPDEFSERFAGPPELAGGRLRLACDDYLDAHGERHRRRMSAVAYRRLSESIDLHRIDSADIRVPTTLVAVDSDALVPAADIEGLAGAIRDARFHRIASLFGHDAFLKEQQAVAAILNDFLESLEPNQ